MLVSDTY